MKIRDSGMPDEAYWETFFDVPLILSRLGIDRYRDVAELGCGYGTFTIPIAKAISGTLYTYDVDTAMISRTKQRGASLRVVCEQRDVMELGFGVHVDPYCCSTSYIVNNQCSCLAMRQQRAGKC